MCWISEITVLHVAMYVMLIIFTTVSNYSKLLKTWQIVYDIKYYQCWSILLYYIFLKISSLVTHGIQVIRLFHYIHNCNYNWYNEYLESIVTDATTPNLNISSSFSLYFQKMSPIAFVSLLNGPYVRFKYQYQF